MRLPDRCDATQSLKGHLRGKWLRISSRAGRSRSKYSSNFIRLVWLLILYTQLGSRNQQKRVQCWVMSLSYSWNGRSKIWYTFPLEYRTTSKSTSYISWIVGRGFHPVRIAVTNWQKPVWNRIRGQQYANKLINILCVLKKSSRRILVFIIVMIGSSPGCTLNNAIITLWRIEIWNRANFRAQPTNVAFKPVHPIRMSFPAWSEYFSLRVSKLPQTTINRRNQGIYAKDEKAQLPTMLPCSSFYGIQ